MNSKQLHCVTLWFSEISRNEWGITSFSRPDSSSCSQQDHCSWIPVLFFQRWLAGHHWRWLQTLERALPQLVPKHAELGDLLGHAAKGVSGRTGLSWFGWLDSWWIDHLVLLRFHVSVNYVRIPQIRDRHLLPFFGIFVVFFSLFCYFKVDGD